MAGAGGLLNAEILGNIATSFLFNPMAILEDLVLLIVNPTTNSGFHTSKINSSSSKIIGNPRTFNTKIVSVILACGLLFYLFPPFSTTSKSLQKMFSKRPDRYTTGLINMRNDCFANSSIQAYSSLPGLTDYLNKFIEAFNSMMEAVKSLRIDLDEVVPVDSLSDNSISKDSKSAGTQRKLVNGRFRITLHIALAKIVKKLQETQMTTRTISVWTFLHELERIYNARISRSQHDAHELTQLINETLETENLNCIKVFRAIKNHYQLKGEIPLILQEIEVPEFPFNGLLLSQMKCLDCSSVSKPSITPFLMLTLHPPQETSTTIETLLDENESETITGYQCLKCRLLKIIANEDHFGKDERNRNFERNVQKLRELNKKECLFINEDLPSELESFVKSYDRGGLKIANISSTVHRKTHILKPPKVFGIHLSRSAFNGVTVSRNPCRVAFSDKLTLSIGNEYLADLQKFQQNAIDEAYISRTKSRVLTTDANDMEDESLQREDIEVTGEEPGVESEDKDTESNEWTASESEMDDTDSANLSSAGLSSPSTLPNGKATETLQNAPISEDQTISLLNHFRKFKFTENNNYKYRLKAIIRHQGSHTQGHYECFKRKPLFVKDNDGNIIKISPEIDESNLIAAEEITNESDAVLKRRSSSNSTIILQGSDDLSERGHFRRKISTIMGRRPSVLQADPGQANVQEIIQSGLATPAEVLVDDCFQLPTADEILNQLRKIDYNSLSKVKMKKLSSTLKHPYWRVGDAQVAEVSRSAVMFETSSVYMLYYERIDRKQIVH